MPVVFASFISARGLAGARVGGIIRVRLEPDFPVQVGGRPGPATDSLALAGTRIDRSRYDCRGSLSLRFHPRRR